MIKAQAPDKRPALAFDEKKEVQVIRDALNAYRINHIDKCEEMFNKKGK